MLKMMLAFCVFIIVVFYHVAMLPIAAKFIKSILMQRVFVVMLIRSGLG